jgi:hypothetical protein
MGLTEEALRAGGGDKKGLIWFGAIAFVGISILLQAATTEPPP